MRPLLRVESRFGGLRPWDHGVPKNFEQGKRPGRKQHGVKQPAPGDGPLDLGDLRAGEFPPRRHVPYGRNHAFGVGKRYRLLRANQANFDVVDEFEIGPGGRF